MLLISPFYDNPCNSSPDDYELHGLYSDVILYQSEGIL